MKSIELWGLVLAALLAGCTTDPEPEPNPDADPQWTLSYHTPLLDTTGFAISHHPYAN